MRMGIGKLRILGRAAGIFLGEMGLFGPSSWDLGVGGDRECVLGALLFYRFFLSNFYFVG